MERHEEHTTRLQDAGELGEGAGHLRAVEMDDRVESHHPPAGVGFERQVEHVPDAVLHIRVRGTRQLDHRRCNVDADRRRSSLGEIAGHMSGPAADVGDAPAPHARHTLHDRNEHETIERLVLQLTLELGGVIARHCAVPFAEPGRLASGRMFIAHNPSLLAPIRLSWQ